MTFAGTVLQGLVLGALTSLTAMGLVLVYRSARIVNFAQAEMGGLAATTAVVLVVSFRLPFPAAAGIGLAVALATGALVELVVVRRLTDAPKLVLTVATIGVAEVVGAGEVWLPNHFPARRSMESFGLPWHVNWRVGGFVFTANHALAVGTALACAAGLWWFLERTDRGAAMLAAADSREKALLLGIRVRALSFLTWSLAAVLSGAGAILAQPILGTSAGQIAGPATLLAPLAAAVVARLHDVRTAVVASFGIGVFEQGVLWATHDSSPAVDVALFAVIVGALLLQSRSSTRAGEPGLVEFEEPVRRMARSVRSTARMRVLATLAASAVAAAAIAGPLGLSKAPLILLSFMAIYAIVAVSLVVLTGWAGQISLGQFAFVGLGGALCAGLLVHDHVNLLACLLAGAVGGAAVAAVIGLPALRIPGLQLAVATLAFAVPVSTYVLSGHSVPWLNPPQVPRPSVFGRLDLGSQRTFYYLCLAALVLVIFLAHNLRQSRTGRTILAVRDNAEAAAAYGIRPVRTRLGAFAVSGAFAGLAGGLYVVGLGGLGPSSGGLDPQLSLAAFTMVAIGGTGTILGGVIGAAYVEAVQYFLTGALQYLATGAGLLVLLLVMPRGLASLAYTVRDRIVERWGRVQPSRPVARTSTHLATAALEMREIELAIPDRERERYVRTSGDGAVPSGSELLGCSGIRAGYGRTEVLHGVGLSIGPGEIVALLGPNGSGKTTVLRTFAGLTRPSGGMARYKGRRLSRVPVVERVEQGIVTVLGGRSVFPSLTVERNLRLGAWLLRHDGEAVERGIQWVLGVFPVLAQRLDIRAGLLSGGEQQMLALAQALLCRPRVLLVDELSLGLAPVVVQQLLSVVRELAASGVGVLLVEQSLNVATAVADRSALLERGVLVFCGPTPNVAERPDLLRSVFLRSSHEALRRAGDSPPPPAPARLPALSVRKVSRSFGGIRAVHEVDLSLRHGEILGVVGPNGSGKTTLLDLCSGFLVPDSGQIIMYGKDVTGLSPARRSAQGVGRVFQNAYLFPSLTVWEAVAVALERRIALKDPLASALRVHDAVESERDIQARAEAAVAEVGLTPWRENLVSELSTGLRRLLEIACVVVHRPRLLLLDEPSAGIAQRERGPLAEVILGLKETTGATFVVVEHDVPLVSRLADQVVCMNLGSVLAQGRAADVFSDHRVIDTYLGTALV